MAVNIEAGTGDGRFLVEAGVRSVPVVEVSPRPEEGKSFSGVLIEASVGPFADGGLDEAFGLAVSAGSVDAGANVFEIEFAAGLGEAVGIKAGAVVGHDAARSNAETGEVNHGLVQEVAGGCGGFVRM